jgi:hypothetical protein
VTAWVEDRTLRLEVRDDGGVGALATGSGLQGLADRLGALDEPLEIESPADGGTLVAAAIPIPPAQVGDVRLHYIEAGDGPLVLLLHGFPEFWDGWRRQIAPLARAGFRVVAPDLRGYNLSTGPDDFAGYTADRLAADIQASSTSSAQSPGWSSVTTGAEPSPGAWPPTIPRSSTASSF